MADKLVHQLSLGSCPVSRLNSLSIPTVPSAPSFECPVDGIISFVVLGASGDLAKKKIFPVLWTLYKNNLIDRRSTLFFGYARSDITAADVADRFDPYIKVADEDKEIYQEFRERLIYVKGDYESPDAFKALDKAMSAKEDEMPCHEAGKNRIFYLALPPNVFIPVATNISDHCKSKEGWNRVIIEKPFGHDSDSYEELATHLSRCLAEQELYRIDHYLGKEMVQNMLILRFANRIFQPLWNHEHIACVQISFKEPFGTKGRGGYFDNYGIIRDVMQNHLLQVLTMVAMERPLSTNADDIRDEKVKVLKCIKPIRKEDIVIGQYTAGHVDGDEDSHQGYLDDPTVPKGSKTPTFATAVLYVNNERWEGVPFILRCGKALNERKAEIRVQFKDAVASPFQGESSLGRNELVVRVQPNEAVYLKFMNKMPGMGFDPIQSELDLSYNLRYKGAHLPEAYERLILDVIQGVQINFVRGDELREAWRLFTPVLKQIEDGQIDPIPYRYGTRGPDESDKLVKKLGYVYHEDYQWTAPQ